MKALMLAMIAAGLTMGANAQSGTCQTPLTWSLSFIYDAGSAPAAIYSDGANGSNPSYVNGVDGVTALITCKGDATVNTGGSATRTIGWNFGQVLFTNNAPSWSGTSFYDHSFLNIEQILYTPPGFNSTQSFTFTTRMVSQLNNKGTKNQLYHLRMENPTDQAVTTAPADPTANTPNMDVLVIVQHIPASAAPSGKETWVAYPDPSSSPAQVGTLLQDQRTGSALNVGQYTMPFKFTISRQ